MTRDTGLTEKDVRDYVDERASPDVIRAIEDSIERDWMVAQLVAAYREQVANMHRAFGRHARDIPPAMSEILRKATGNSPR